MTRTRTRWLFAAAVLLIVVLVAVNWRTLWLHVQVQRVRHEIVADEWRPNSDDCVLAAEFDDPSAWAALASLLADRDPTVWGEVAWCLPRFVRSTRSDADAGEEFWRGYCSRRPASVLRVQLVSSEWLFPFHYCEEQFERFLPVAEAGDAVEALALVKRVLSDTEPLAPNVDAERAKDRALLALLAFHHAAPQLRDDVDELIASLLAQGLPPDDVLEIGRHVLADGRSAPRSLESWSEEVGMIAVPPAEMDDDDDGLGWFTVEGDDEVDAEEGRRPRPQWILPRAVPQSTVLADPGLLSALSYVDRPETLRIFALLSGDSVSRAALDAALAGPGFRGVERPLWLPLEEAAERFLADPATPRAEIAMQALAVLRSERARELLRSQVAKLDAAADAPVTVAGTRLLARALLWQCGDDSVRGSVEGLVQVLLSLDSSSLASSLDSLHPLHEIVGACLAAGSGAVLDRVEAEGFSRDVYHGAVHDWEQVPHECRKLMRYAHWDARQRAFVPPRALDEWERRCGIVRLPDCGHDCGVVTGEPPQLFRRGVQQLASSEHASPVQLVVPERVVLSLLARKEPRVLRLIALLAPRPEQRAYLKKLQWADAQRHGERPQPWFPVEETALRWLDGYETELRLLGMQVLAEVDTPRARRILECRAVVEPVEHLRLVAQVSSQRLSGVSAPRVADQLEGGLLNTRDVYEEHAAALWLGEYLRAGSAAALTAAIRTVAAPEGDDEEWIVPVLLGGIAGVPSELIEGTNFTAHQPFVDRSDLACWLEQVAGDLKFDSGQKRFVVAP